MNNEITSTGVGVDVDTAYDDLPAVSVELTIKDSDVEDVAVNPTEVDGHRRRQRFLRVGADETAHGDGDRGNIRRGRRCPLEPDAFEFLDQ